MVMTAWWLAWLFACTVLFGVQARVSELSSSNFTSYLTAFDGDSRHVIEFYANWCPHCRHFKPTYEQVAGFFEVNAEAAPVHIARADCALEVHLLLAMHYTAALLHAQLCSEECGAFKIACADATHNRACGMHCGMVMLCSAAYVQACASLVGSV